jgi:ABC-type amino acid transport substrate-binding protein
MSQPSHSSEQKRRYRYLWSGITIIAIGIVALIWWVLIPGDDGTLTAIQQRGVIRVGLDASFPPFEAIDADGEIVGLDVDLAAAIAADLGVEVELVNIGFDGLYDALLARRVELVISGLPYDPRWTQDIAYSQSYFNAGQVLLVPADGNAAAISSPTELAGQVVAVEWGSRADMEGRRLAGEHNDLVLLRQPTARQAIEAVLNNQAQAAIVDGVSGAAAQSQGLRMESYLSDEWYAAAVHIESLALLKAVDLTLERLKESGEMQTIQERWLSTPPE